MLTYSELFILLLILRLISGREITIYFPVEVLAINISIILFVILPLGGYKGLLSKFRDNFG